MTKKENPVLLAVLINCCACFHAILPAEGELLLMIKGPLVVTQGEKSSSAARWKRRDDR